jgi:hypothetical protein
VIVEVDAANRSTTRTPPNGAWGIVCRARDNQNLYALAISQDGTAIIAKAKNGQLTALAQGHYINSDTSTNHIRGDCVEDTLTLYVDGEKIIEARDSDHKSGRVGLTVDPQLNVSFDNFSVSKP